MTCLLKDLQTGATATYDGGDLFWWSEGNGSCDCNRILAFTPEGIDNDDHDVCLGSNRFIAIDILDLPTSINKQETLIAINKYYK